MYMIDTNVLMSAVLCAVLVVGALVVGATGVGAWSGARGRAMSYLYMFSAMFVTFGAVVAVMGFRGQKSDARPWHFFLDMKYQAKYTSQGASKFFADGRSNRPALEGTIPFDGTDYAADAGSHAAPNPDFLKADKRYYTGVANPTAKEQVEGVEVPAKPKWENGALAGEGYYVNLVPPLAVERAGGWEALFKRGQTQFNRNCAVCHGTSGRGGAGELAYGIVGAYGLSVPPSNLMLPLVQSQPDGQLYHALTNGVRNMPAYGHQVRDPLDRWAIVAYLRELQFAYGNEVLDKK